MDAARLSVLVEAKGIEQVTKGLHGVDDGLRKTAGQADKTSRDLEDTGKRGGKSLGGLGKIAGALGGVAVGAGLVKGMKLATAEFEEARKVGALTESTIKATGGAANITAKQVGALAGAISKKVGIDDEAIQSGSNLLLTFKNVRNEAGKGNDVFNQATKAAVDLSAAGFGSIESASKTMGKALNDPIKGMTALGKSGVTFSEDQKKAIAALMETGKASDRLKAQQIILKEVQSQVGGAAAAQATPMDHLKVTMGNLAEAAGSVLVPAIDKGAKILTYLVGGMIESKGAGGALISVFRSTGGVIGDLVQSIVGLVKWFGEHKTVALALAAGVAVLGTAYLASLIPALIAGTSAIWSQVSAWIGLRLAFLASPIGLVIVGLTALAAGLVVAYRESETFRKIVDAVFAWLKGAATTVFGFLKTFIPDAWNVIKVVTTTVWAAISGVLSTVFNAIRAVVTTVFPAIQAIITTAWTVISAVTSTIWTAIKAVLTTLWTGITAAAGLAFEAIKAVITTAWTVISTVTSTVWNAIKTALSVIWEAIKGAAGLAWTAIKAVIVEPITSLIAWAKLQFENFKVGLGVVWGAIKSAAGTAWAAIKSAIITPIGDAASWVWEKVQWLADRVSSGWDRIVKGASDFAGNVKDTIVSAFKGAANLVIGFVNAIIGAINAIPGVPNIGKIDKLAEGGVHGGGPNGNGMARGGAFARTGGIVNQPITLMGEEAPRAPEFVIPTNPAYRGRAQQLLMQAAGAIGMAEGGIFGAVKGAVGGAASAVGGVLSGGASSILNMLPGVGSLPDWLKGSGKWVLDKVTGWIKEKIAGLFGVGGGASGGPSGPTPSGSLNDWLSQALRITGQYSAANLAALYRRAMQESGGDPKAINLWDSNAKAGIPSKGLLQTIDPTFNSYKLAGHNDIWNPVDNAIAAIRYMLGRYGHIVDANGQGYARGGVYGGVLGSYANGTNYVPQTGPYMLHRGESVTPASSSGPPVVHVSFDGLPVELQRLIRVEIEQDGRRTQGTWSAGVAR